MRKDIKSGSKSKKWLSAKLKGLDKDKIEWQNNFGMKNKPKKTSNYKVIINRNLCIGAAVCVALAPKVFQLDEENKVILVDPSGDTDGNILAAAKSCPVNAITVIDKKTGKQIYP